MPQITYIPPQDRGDELTRDAFARLFTNIEDNIKYRRDQQAKKAAMAERDAQQMRMGLRPSANITYTDEGREFSSNEARNAYFDALGARRGASDMTRKGHTDQTAEVIGAEDHMKKVAIAEGPEAKARRKMMDDAAKAQIAMVQGIHANNPDLIQSDGTLNPNVLGATPNVEAAGAALRETLGTTATTAKELQAREQPTTPPVTPSATAPQAQSLANNPKNANQRTTNSQSTNVSGGMNVSNNIREHDQASFKISEEPVNIEDQEYIKTTKNVETARLDDVKTLFWDLMGMKADEDAIMSAYQSVNPTAASLQKGTFETALAKRQADMQRWEAAATQDGTQTGIEKGGQRVYKSKGGSVEGLVTAKDALAPKFEIDAGVKGNNFGSSSVGGGDPTKNNGLGQVVDASGASIGTSFDPSTNRYSFDNATIDGRTMEKIVKGTKQSDGKWTREKDWIVTPQSDGRTKFTYKHDNKVEFTAKMVNKGAQWINFVGTLPQGIVTDSFQDAGQFRLGTDTQLTDQAAMRAAAVSNAVTDNQLKQRQLNNNQRP